LPSTTACSKKFVLKRLWTAPEVDRQSTLVNAMLPLIHSLAGGLLIAAKGHPSLRYNVQNTA
jgi:hypothetical protein